MRLAACLLLAALSANSAEWTKTVRLNGSPELRVGVPDADVTIMGWDRPEVTTRVTTVGWKISDTEVQVLQNQAGNVLELEVVIPKLGFTFGRRVVKVQMQVPRELGCEVKTTLGNISVRGISGRMVLESEGGSIEAVGIAGKLEARTGQGRLWAAGRLNLLTLRAGFGSVDVDIAAGSQMLSPWRIGTDDGNISVRLPATFQADLDARSDVGKVRVNVPYKPTADVNNGSARGTMNGGGQVLALRTGGGDIHVLTSR